MNDPRSSRRPHQEPIGYEMRDGERRTLTRRKEAVDRDYRAVRDAAAKAGLLGGGIGWDEIINWEGER